MTSSPSQFANAGKLQVLPTSNTLLFTQSTSNMGNATQYLRQPSTPNGTMLQQPMTSGIMSTPTSIVRVNQPQTMQQNHIPQNQGQYTSQTLWSNSMPQSPQHQFTLQKTAQQTPIVHFTTVKNEPIAPVQQQQHQQQQQQQHQQQQFQQQQHQQTSILPAKVVTQSVVRQTVGPQQTTVYTESQINDFVSKCRTFLTTLLRLAEKQAPEKLPMVRSCIQELLDGTIDPESFTQRLHTLYKSQPHTSLVPFFKLLKEEKSIRGSFTMLTSNSIAVGLAHMRQIVKNTYGRPINIDLLEKLQLPSSNTNSSTANTITHAQLTNTSVVVNPSLLTQQQHGAPILQQPLYTTVQPQQKINLLQQASQPSLIGSTASLLSQQQQQQQQARTQINIAGIRPLLTSLSPSNNSNLFSGQQQHAQPVAQMIIQPSDTIFQRSIISSNTSTTKLQQPQIITVNPQPMKTEPMHSQPSPLNPLSSFQQKSLIKTEDDYADDHNHAGPADSRHIAHDDRLIPAMTLRRRHRDLAEKDKRTTGVALNDDAALALVSHAAQERLKYIIEQMKLIAQHRIDLSMKNDPAYQQTSDVKSQIRFLEDLDKIEKQKKDKLEQEKIFRAAKSRSKTNDPEAAKLKQKAKEMQQAQVEEQRQKEANETALAAIGKPKKRKLEESTNHVHQPSMMSSNGPEQISPIQPSPSSSAAIATTTMTTTATSKSKAAKRICRANLRDLLLIMERDKYLKRSTLLVKALNK